MGGCSIDAHGTPLTDETLAAAKAADAVLLGSIGGPKWGTGAEFPDLKVEHQLIDSAAMIMVKNPTGLNGVVVTSNLFGDIISDEASVIPGSIGLLPSASLSGIPDGKSKCNGIYEPIHGSAPGISGQRIVNPIGTILSVAMLLRYSLNLHAEAKAVEDAVRAALDSGLRSKDLGGNATTKEAGDAVVRELARILSYRCFNLSRGDAVPITRLMPGSRLRASSVI
ncbi:Isocitrate/isopropylmalate dehydrogenase-domain-containing protein [Dactylonectria macrodidyma]|uniref:3-isopropylmalate dehydrogenase n=1 Tax=Dactylonectria macrodidyma TaxID=307937 RepID=A0A9P9JH16_9HYPO|nr:Isocitrate/isopropylmalate dehydrogenase-domain-containing protein [Dactylonectria macrodidyma]